MYYKECEQNDTGLESAAFLAILALRTKMMAVEPVPSTLKAFDRIAADYTRQALALSPLAGCFNFFGEEQASFGAGTDRRTGGQR